MNKNILIVGGGTGGHISPGLALFEKFSEDGQVTPFFLTGKSDMRFSTFSDLDAGKLFTYNAPALTRNPFKVPAFFLKFIIAMLRVKRIIRKKNISAVIGMGGYVSAPALAAARMSGTPYFLCEQNSVPGKVTTMFEKKCINVFSTFDGAAEYLRLPEKFVHCGNPIRNSVLVPVNRTEAKKAFHLGHCSRIILVIGGSQGAVKLNELTLDLKRKYLHEFKNVGIIWSTGDLSFEEYKTRSQKEPDAGSVYISPYVKRVGKAYSACDIAISRSGAGVMMELAAAGVPSILIPYPYAAMGHQDKNADAFVKAGAAVKINDSDAVADKVAPVLFELLSHPRKLKDMAANAKKAAMTDAADVIIKHIKETLTNRG